MEVKLEDEEARKIVEIKGEKDAMVKCPVYYDGESVTGQVRVVQQHVMLSLVDHSMHNR